MTKEDRFKYYASREWALLKEAVKERSGGRCERCRVGHHESTHHLTYERFGSELLEDLQGVCEPCHAYLSGKKEDDPEFETAEWAYFLINGAWDISGYRCSMQWTLHALGKHELAKRAVVAFDLFDEISESLMEFDSLMLKHIQEWREIQEIVDANAGIGKTG